MSGPTAALVLLIVEGPAPEDVKAGWLGFGVFLALAAVLVFLFFSMRKHLRRVDFEEPPGDLPGEPTDPGREQTPS